MLSYSTYTNRSLRCLRCLITFLLRLCKFIYTHTIEDFKLNVNIIFYVTVFFISLTFD